MDDLVDPNEPLERQNARLRQIASALMRRVEGKTEPSGAAYSQFERAVMLEEQVRRRTEELETALTLLNESNARISAAMKETEEARADLASAVEAVRAGLALFGADDVLLLFNERFCWKIPDVREKLEVGMTFRDYVVLVGKSKYLDFADDAARQAWVQTRLSKHRKEHLFFNLALKGDQWLQINEQRTANAGTAIVQADVTDLMRAERTEREKLLDGQARMIRATLDHLRQGVAIFDADIRLVGRNDRLQMLTRLPSDSCQIGMSFVRLAEHLAGTFSMRNAAEERRLAMWVQGQIPAEPLSFEIRHGSDTTLDVFMQRLPEGGFVISFTDVTRERVATRTLARAKSTLERRVKERTTELQDALQAAQRSNAAKTRFVAAASHDLLQPLSAAKLYLAGAGADAASDAITKAERALTSVEEIIGALLDISRLDTEDREFDLMPVRLNDIFGSMSSAFAPKAAAKGLDLRILPCSATVLSDGSYLMRIVQNLVSNAIRYTDTGRVTVGVRARGAGVELAVHDTGPGIPEADQVRIFEEFTRLDRRASASEGMGLGLAIVERACARLNHPLRLESVPGRGSSFYVSLDRAQPIGQGIGAPFDNRTRSVSTLSTAGLIVLLVDNDHDLRGALAALLEGWGVGTLEASSPDEAFDLIEDLGIIPDALLFDQQLDRGETGLALALTFMERFGEIPARIISANRSEGLRDACAAAGLVLLPKPLDTAALREFLEETVKQL